MRLSAKLHQIAKVWPPVRAEPSGHVSHCKSSRDVTHLDEEIGETGEKVGDGKVEKDSCVGSDGLETGSSMISVSDPHTFGVRKTARKSTIPLRVQPTTAAKVWKERKNTEIGSIIGTERMLPQKSLYTRFGKDVIANKWWKIIRSISSTIAVYPPDTIFD